MKKLYKTPQLKTEKVEIGVFGAYGSVGSTGPIAFLNPLFGWCCS